MDDGEYVLPHSESTHAPDTKIEVYWIGEDGIERPIRRRKDATELVRALQAQPPDAAQRERAVNDLRSAVDAADYDLMTGMAGDLGGAES